MRYVHAPKELRLCRGRAELKDLRAIAAALGLSYRAARLSSPAATPPKSPSTTSTSPPSKTPTTTWAASLQVVWPRRDFRNGWSINDPPFAVVISAQTFRAFEPSPSSWSSFTTPASPHFPVVSSALMSSLSFQAS